MQKLIIEPGHRTPGIILSPEENLFRIYGTSSPEDVRIFYYPVMEWIKRLIDEITNDRLKIFTDSNPLRFQIDLLYFNSSSAKFLADILKEMKKLSSIGIPVAIEWYCDEDDIELKEAGKIFSELVKMKFTFIPNPS